jgi:uncharacterized protein with ParB-like and HNH nuclease domain
MNNAANNIVVATKSLKGLLLEKRFKVGYFQREYKWKKENIEDLLTDLERSFFANWEIGHIQTDVAKYDKYCMGPIVLFQDGAEFSIVDGQQRLTSFTLLLIYLNEMYKDVYGHPDKLKGYIFSEYYGTETYNLNIPDRIPALDSLFKKLPLDETINLNESCDNIINRFDDIVELFPIRLLHNDVFPLFLNWLTDNLVFIEILTQTSESAYTIFETMNDRGLKLTQSELLKSYLLSNVRDDLRIKNLDLEWKKKIVALNKYATDDEENFFMAWLRAKYAVTIRLTEKGAVNEDFEKIGTRYSNWVQENSETHLHLDKRDSDSYYYFVHSDFQFYSDIYIRLTDLEYNETLPEHDFRLLSFKGISNSLSYPFILAPLQKKDSGDLISDKINLTVKYLDALAIYKLLAEEPITQSSVRNKIYTKLKEIRNTDLEGVKAKLLPEIESYREKFLKEPVYIPFDSSYSKYILSRLYKSKHPEVPFENIHFQRRKDSFTLYQFLTNNDVEAIVSQIPKGLKDLFILGLCSYVVVPKNLINTLDVLPIVSRIQFLIRHNFMLEFSDINEINASNLQSFFVERNKRMKGLVSTLWRL